MKNTQILQSNTFTLIRNLAVHKPEQIAEIFRAIKDPAQEKLVALALDENDKLLGVEVLGLGPLDARLALPKDIFKDCVLAAAKQLIIVRNRAAGPSAPTEADRALHKCLIESGVILDIKVKHYIIFSGNTWSALSATESHYNHVVDSPEEIQDKARRKELGTRYYKIIPELVITYPKIAVDAVKDVFDQDSQVPFVFLCDTHSRILSMKLMPEVFSYSLVKECVLNDVSGFVLCSSFPLDPKSIEEIRTTAEAFEIHLIDAVEIAAGSAAVRSFRKEGAFPSRSGTFQPATRSLVDEARAQLAAEPAIE